MYGILELYNSYVICGCNTCDNCMNWYGLLIGGKAVLKHIIGDLIFFFELHSSATDGAD